MIKILKNGEEKKYYARCGKCGTEIEYELSDVKRETSHAYNGEIKSVICPICGETISVSLLSKEEFYDRNRSGFLGGFSCFS